MPLSSSPSTQRRRVGGRGMLVNSIHGVDTLRYVVVHSGLSCTCFTEVLCSYAILYRLSTSNHNLAPVMALSVWLSYIVFLHQTTTMRFHCRNSLHCLISSFYIKPQQYIIGEAYNTIVLYRLSTSNHNPSSNLSLSGHIVLYRLSTSNHNNIFATK